MENKVHSYEVDLLLFLFHSTFLKVKIALLHNSSNYTISYITIYRMSCMGGLKEQNKT